MAWYCMLCSNRTWCVSKRDGAWKGTLNASTWTPDTECIEASTAHAFRRVNLQATVHDSYGVIVAHSPQCVCCFCDNAIAVQCPAGPRLKKEQNKTLATTVTVQTVQLWCLTSFCCTMLSEHRSANSTPAPTPLLSVLLEQRLHI